MNEKKLVGWIRADEEAKKILGYDDVIAWKTGKKGSVLVGFAHHPDGGTHSFFKITLKEKGPNFVSWINPEYYNPEYVEYHDQKHSGNE